MAEDVFNLFNDKDRLERFSILDENSENLQFLGFIVQLNQTFEEQLAEIQTEVDEVYDKYLEVYEEHIYDVENRPVEA